MAVELQPLSVCPELCVHSASLQQWSVVDEGEVDGRHSEGGLSHWQHISSGSAPRDDDSVTSTGRRSGINGYWQGRAWGENERDQNEAFNGLGVSWLQSMKRLS